MGLLGAMAEDQGPGGVEVKFHLLCLSCPLRTLGNNIPFLTGPFCSPRTLFSFPCLPKVAQSNGTGCVKERGEPALVAVGS